jgi:hypothetical protein
MTDLQQAIEFRRAHIDGAMSSGADDVMQAKRGPERFEAGCMVEFAKQYAKRSKQEQEVTA